MAELWDVLDENGLSTGRVHERGKPMNKGEYHLEVYVVYQNLWKTQNILTHKHHIAPSVKPAFFVKIFSSFPFGGK